MLYKILFTEIYGSWSAWSQWDKCSKTCESGIQKQNRSCDMNRATTYCVGSETESRICNTFRCPGILDVQISIK
jgi:hypothetical protein